MASFADFVGQPETDPTDGEDAYFDGLMGYVESNDETTGESVYDAENFAEPGNGEQFMGQDPSVWSVQGEEDRPETFDYGVPAIETDGISNQLDSTFDFDNEAVNPDVTESSPSTSEGKVPNPDLRYLLNKDTGEVEPDLDRLLSGKHVGQQFNEPNVKAYAAGAALLRAAIARQKAIDDAPLFPDDDDEAPEEVNAEVAAAAVEQEAIIREHIAYGDVSVQQLLDDYAESLPLEEPVDPQAAKEEAQRRGNYSWSVANRDVTLGFLSQPIRLGWPMEDGDEAEGETTVDMAQPEAANLEDPTVDSEVDLDLLVTYAETDMGLGNPEASDMVDFIDATLVPFIDETFNPFGDSDGDMFVDFTDSDFLDGLL